MTIYEKAKNLVTAREAAEHYGLTVNRYGMALKEAQLKADLYNLQRQMEKIPPEIVAMYTGKRLSRERGD